MADDFNWNEFPEVKPEETAPEEAPKSNLSQLQALERGAEQGLSLGFSDELRGAMQAAPEVLTGDQKLMDLYRQYRDIEREKLSALKSEYPKTFVGGEVAGGLSTALIPGLGLAKGASAASTIGKSALQGALTGVGTSGEDVTQGDYEQTLKNALVGGTIGGTVGAGAAALRSIPQLAKESEALKKMSRARQLEKEGISLTSSKAREEAAKDVYQQAKSLKGELEELGKKTSANVEKVYESSKDVDLTKQTQDILMTQRGELEKLASIQRLASDRKQAVLDAIDHIDDALYTTDEAGNKILKSNINPQELRELRDKFKTLGKAFKNPQTVTPDTQDIEKLSQSYKKVSTNIGNMLNKEVPGLAEANIASHESIAAQDLLNTVSSLFERKSIQNEQQIANMITQLEKSGISAQRSMDIFDKLAEHAEKAGNPELANNIRSTLPKLAERFDLTQEIGKSPIGFKGLRSLGTRGAAYIGRAEKKLAETLPEMPKVLPEAVSSLENVAAVPAKEFTKLTAEATSPSAQSRALYDASPEELSQVSQKLIATEDPKIREYGEALQRAVMTNNARLKNATLFNILQNPNSRSVVKP